MTRFASILVLVAACAASPTPPPSGGDDDEPGPGSGPEPTPTIKHGDICVAPAFDCGTGNNLVCVVDNPGDSQGVCRLACSNFSACLNNDEARSMFDNDCCNIGNGGRVCDQDEFYPPGSCN
jgi:hypothetical protein